MKNSQQNFLVLFKGTSLRSLLRSLVVKLSIDNIFVERLGFIKYFCVECVVSRTYHHHNLYHNSSDELCQLLFIALLYNCSTVHRKEARWPRLKPSLSMKILYVNSFTIKLLSKLLSEFSIVVYLKGSLWY